MKTQGFSQNSKIKPRIISGSLRGMKLEVPKDGTRPMTDRVKSALFSIIQFKIIKSNILDLYAGTGALGIECLSRGAKSAVFVDKAEEAVNIIQQNLERAGFSNLSAVIRKDTKEFLNTGSDKKTKKFEIIFFSPPHKSFNLGLLEKTAEYLSVDGILVSECNKKTKTPEELGGLCKFDERVYGITKISFWKQE